MRHRPKFTPDEWPEWVERVVPPFREEPQPVGTCPSGKVRFGSRSDARIAGLHARQRRKHVGTDTPDRFECGLYQCPACHRWHVTSDPEITDTVEFF